MKGSHSGDRGPSWIRSRFRRRGARLTRSLGGLNSLLAPPFRALALVGLLADCAGTPPHAAMPTPLVGLDVIVGPDVALSGEGVRRFPTFGQSLAYAIRSQLQTDGFEIVTAERGQNAVRIGLQANLEVSRSKYIFVNGRPLESTSARVAVKVLALDGTLVDAFEVSGDPEDAETPGKVAAKVAGRIKGSARLVALAKAGPPATVPRSSVPVTSAPILARSDAAERPAGAAPVAPASSPASAQVSPMVARGVCESMVGNTAPGKGTGRGPEVAQIRLGMTRDEVATICCRVPHVTVRELFVVINQRGQEESVAVGRAGRGLLDEPYLTHITCGSGAGLTDIGFSPPPAENRVWRIEHRAYGESIGSSPEAYLAELLRAYGKPKAQLGPDTIDRSRQSVNREYKWLFPRGPTDRDCTPPMQVRDESTFGIAPPDPHSCATQLTVRIASDPTHVISANFKLFNSHDLDETYDRHVAALNRRYGTNFEDAKTLYARRIEQARQAAASEKRQEEAARRAAMTPEERAREDTDRDVNAFNNAIRSLQAAAAAEQAANGGDNRTTQSTGSSSRAGALSTPRPVGASSAEEAEERRRQCHQRCEQAAQGHYCQFGEDGNECRQDRAMNLSTCNMSCP